MAASFGSLSFGDGLTQQGAGPDATEHHFTGKERDAESGLDNFGARYYGSTMGRFMSPDYSDDETDPEPVPWANDANLQSLNLYSYVYSNPLTNADSDGHSVRVCPAGDTTSPGSTCTTIQNDKYEAAQRGNNGRLNVPSLDTVGMNGDGNGQFNSTPITDANGHIVGSATYVSNGARIITLIGTASIS